VKQNGAELCFVAGTVPYFVKQVFEVSRSAVVKHCSVMCVQ